MARMIPLNQISVAKPCHESWDAMTGDDKKRFCGGCKKNVYNLSAMTEAEAQETLKIDNPCVRFYRRVDGTILTQDCPVGVRRVRVRLAMAASGAVAAIASTLAGRQTLADVTMGAPPPITQHMGEPTSPAIMGDVALPVTPKPVQGQPLMGKVAAPSKPHAKPPKNHGHKAPQKIGTSTPPPVHTVPPPPPPMQQPTMGIVALPQHSGAPKTDKS
jgi:hypothetical protein